MVGVRRRFTLADIAQQAVGGFLLAGPFVVTEEVWVLARNVLFAQTPPTPIIVLAVGYGALYKADDRDPDRERGVGGILVRFISLISISYPSVFILVLVFDAPGTLLLDVSGEVLVSVLGYELDPMMLRIALRAMSVGAAFSVIGVVTADSLL